MKVYPVQSRLILAYDETHDEGDEIIGVYTTLVGAMEFVGKRTGKKFCWEHHDAHGQSWVAEDNFRINNGPLITCQYAITEHEVRE